ncbi:MAG: HPr family phosphocarrier protein [Myxococcota bacterium]
MNACETLTIRNRLGLHARAATKLVQTANRFRAEIQLERDGAAVNGKSIVDVLTLAAAQGTTITVRARGEDAQEAIDAIRILVDGLFGERS